MSRPGFGSLVGSSLARRFWRNALLLLCAAAVTGMQVAAAVIERASAAGLAQGLGRLGADLVAVPRGLDLEVERSFITGEAALFYMDDDALAKIKSFPFVAQTSPQLYIKSLSGAACCSAWNIFLIGFDPETDFTVRPWLDARPGREMGADEILVGAALSNPAGTKLKFYGREFTVAGALAPSGLGLDVSVFIPLPAAYAMAESSGRLAEEALNIPLDKISSVMIRLVPEGEGGEDPAKAAYLLEKALPAVTVIQPAEMTVMVQRNLSGTLKALKSGSAAVWPVAALLIGLVFALAAGERRRELGLLRSLGATRRFIFGMIVSEALVITGAGGLLGVAAAVGITAGFARLIAKTLEVPFAWPDPGAMAVMMVAAVGLALMTGAAAAWYPAWRVSRMEPYEAVRRGNE